MQGLSNSIAIRCRPWSPFAAYCHPLPQFSSVQFRSVQFSPVQISSVQSNPVQFHSVNSHASIRNLYINSVFFINSRSPPAGPILIIIIIILIIQCAAEPRTRHRALHDSVGARDPGPGTWDQGPMGYPSLARQGPMGYPCLASQGPMGYPGLGGGESTDVCAGALWPGVSVRTPR